MKENQGIEEKGCKESNTKRIKGSRAIVKEKADKIDQDPNPGAANGRGSSHIEKVEA